MPRNGSQDQNQHVEAEVQGEVQRNVPQRSTEVVVAVVLNSGRSGVCWGWGWRWWWRCRCWFVMVMVVVKNIFGIVVVREMIVRVMIVGEVGFMVVGIE